MFRLKEDWELEPKPRCLVLEDYVGATPRWCPGCGDHAVLGALQRLARDEQLPPEQTVVVSGIGCSSRFPHYMKTYGFHGLHGRPLPVACGIRARRPDLHVFVVTGDGDCCAIGTAHWIHAVRYNMRMTVMLLDNHVYGLTKAQSSPTSRLGQKSNTHPFGAPLRPLNPLTVTLGITNASFVAQTLDWNPPHLYATLAEAHRHRGLSFVRVLQRCPHYLEGAWDGVQRDPTRVLLLTHANGIPLDESLARPFTNRVEHDPSDLARGRELAAREDVVPIGLFFRDEDAERYDELSAAGLGMSTAEKLGRIEAELERFVI
ncbi:MAG TPA: thiamine pyrophosphate-dependent enzyme [Candidatus Polarisedimenticolaceae bacterium]|nr:thiamine pyrophosphate-dependent enzyme [Candidatus Polarisedimenticolaceae bacterium]